MKKSSISIIIFTSLILFSVPIFMYVGCFKGFQVKEFREMVEVIYNEPFNYDAGNICYDSFLKCHEVSINHKGKVDTSKIGEYYVYYTYKYKNEILTKKQIVKVKEDEAPIINVEGNNFTICPNQTKTNFKVTAYDNYDKDLTNEVEQYIFGNKVYFKVSDYSGNTRVINRDLNIVDNAPILSLNGSDKIYLKVGEEYQELGAQAFDDCDTDIGSKIEIIGSVDTNKVGEYEIIYKVQDSSYNMQSIRRKVYVYSPNDTTLATGKIIYLTFDDGPSAYTSRLLDILKKYNVKATFFVTNPKGYDNVILRAYKEGHTIGLHTYTHDYKQIYQNIDAYFTDLYAIQEKVKQITGYTSTIIRFPGGSSNTISRKYDGGIKIMSKLSKEVEAKGFKYFDWNISSGDAGLTTNSEEVFTNIIDNLGNKDFYVVLQHDTKDYSVSAVEEVIKYGLAKGYTFMPLSMNSPVVHHHIAN